MPIRQNSATFGLNACMALGHPSNSFGLEFSVASLGPLLFLVVIIVILRWLLDRCLISNYYLHCK